MAMLAHGFNRGYSGAMPNPSGFAARRGALRLLDAVLRRGETLDQAQSGALNDVEGFADRALARAIAGEVLRWMRDLDALINSATRKPLPADAKARHVLRIMLAQALRLETPPHAVIATGLPLLAGGPRRLAHGVFSTLMKRDAKLPETPSLPAAVERRWGRDFAANVASGLAIPPPLDLTLRDASQTAEWAEKLQGFSLMPGHVRLPRGVAVRDLPGYDAGDWWVQDLAASLPARLLGSPQDSESPRRVLDLAAAPGGKTLQLAAAGWQVTALDVSQKRLDTLRENCARTGLAAEIVCADALEWEPDAPFDAILLDAPCSATGTCRRHPDVLHRIGRGQIVELAELQEKLLTRATNWLKPGGRLVYAVCSLEREEGEQVANNLGLPTDPIRADELPEGIAPHENGTLRTHPGLLAEKGGMDGFFIARWKAG
jgi:16S rRNA (cytosine967-C5)-methyltransferase